MKKLYLSAVFALGFTLSGCDAFLTELPKHELTIENVVRDYASAKQVVNGIYGKYETCSSLGGYIPGYLYSQASLWEYDDVCTQMTYKENRNGFAGIWQQLYMCINAANGAILSLEAAPAKVFPSEADRDKLIAEARCMRGFFNLQLLWYFSRWFDGPESPYGIIYREQLSNLGNLMLDRSTVGESYQLIIDDLECGENGLDNYSSSLYASKQFAKAMHAKLLLVRGWNGDYAKALELVNDVLANSPSSFAVESDITQLYEKAWDSREVLFSKNLVDIYNNQTSTTQYEFIYSYGLYYTPIAGMSKDWLKADARYEYITGEADAPEPWAVNEGDKKQEVLTKLYHRGRAIGQNDKYCGYVLRKAELYLMKAELLARTNPGNLAAAIAPVNELRAQYTVPQMDAIPVPASHESLMDILFKEYVVTLFMENETAWFASIRFETDGNTWLKKLKGNDISYTENQYCWPIPNEEMKSHINKIEQNPGLN